MIVGKVLSEDENKELCALAVAIYIKDQLLARTFSNQSRWVYVLHCFICKVLNSIWLSSIHRTFYPFRHNEIKDIQNYNPYKYTNCLYLVSEKFSDDLSAQTHFELYAMDPWFHTNDWHKLMISVGTCLYLINIVFCYYNCITGVRALSAVECGFESRYSQTMDIKTRICCFSAKHATLRCLLRIRIMCQNGVTCLSANCCFSEVAL